MPKGHDHALTLKLCPIEFEFLSAYKIKGAAYNSTAALIDHGPLGGVIPVGLDRGQTQLSRFDLTFSFSRKNSTPLLLKSLSLQTPFFFSPQSRDIV